MADQEKHALLQRLGGDLDMGPVLRIAAWGLTAAMALAIAVFASRSEIGLRRVAGAMNPGQTEAARLASAQAFARAEEAEREVRRLTDTVQGLSADRDKLLNRVASLERSLEDLTGSIALTRPARRPPIADQLLAPGSSLHSPLQPPDAALPTGSLPDRASPALTPPGIDAPMSLAPENPGELGSDRVPGAIPIPRVDPRRAGEIASPTLAPAPNPAGEALTPDPGSSSAREARAPAASSTTLGGRPGQRHGIDLGSATSIEGLRGLWKKIRQGQASPLVADLKPVVSVRDASQPGSVELRLVAGPVPSALAASRLCAALSAAGAPCRATSYDGQSLAAR